MGNNRGGRTWGGLGTSGSGMGGLGIGGGMDSRGSNVHLDGVRSMRDVGSLGGSINGLTGSLSGNLGRLGPDFFKQGDGYGACMDNDNKNGGSGVQGGASSPPSSTTRTGTWSGMGIQRKLSDEGDY